LAQFRTRLPLSRRNPPSRPLLRPRLRALFRQPRKNRWRSQLPRLLYRLNLLLFRSHLPLWQVMLRLR
jgi:hypothetical protein